MYTLQVGERDSRLFPDPKRQAAPEEVPKRGHFPPRATPLLDSLQDEGTARMRNMTVPELKQLSEEVRWQATWLRIYRNATF